MDRRDARRRRAARGIGRRLAQSAAGNRRFGRYGDRRGAGARHCRRLVQGRAARSARADAAGADCARPDRRDGRARCTTPGRSADGADPRRIWPFRRHRHPGGSARRDRRRIRVGHRPGRCALGGDARRWLAAGCRANGGRHAGRTARHRFARGSRLRDRRGACARGVPPFAGRGRKLHRTGLEVRSGRSRRAANRQIAGQPRAHRRLSTDLATGGSRCGPSAADLIAATRSARLAARLRRAPIVPTHRSRFRHSGRSHCGRGWCPLASPSARSGLLRRRGCRRGRW
ncbi:unnamed protein product [Rhizophagus irregularis]|uniref:Uncharacterized protein n=1 Tax=Rhizophagus irregularis TaxID=588596 RepID=A0A915ZDD2_9GLOM|nr:unnamed protein product [Rhizophagus irregularis]